MDIRKFVAVLIGVIALAVASIYCIYNQEYVWAVVFGLFCLEGLDKLPNNDGFTNDEVEAYNKRVDEHNAKVRSNNNSE